MARSNKPIVWGPFAAGGTITAFVTPVLMTLTLLAALGHVPDALTYDALRQLAAHWMSKLVIIAVIFLSLWSTAHRLRITCYDLGVRSDTLVASVVYFVAIAGTVSAAVFLSRI